MRFSKKPTTLGELLSTFKNAPNVLYHVPLMRVTSVDS